MSNANEYRIVPIGRGGGWYNITRNGSVKAMARGIRAAEAKLAEVAAQPDTPAPDIHAVYLKFIGGNR